MDLKELVRKFDHGDPLSDEELKHLIKKLTVLVDTLDEMNQKSYWLMYIDLNNKLKRCKEYMEARNEDRPRKKRKPEYIPIRKVYKGYDSLSAQRDSLLVCPHCHKRQEDSVKDHCVVGRPDRSKSECIHCYKPFGVIKDGSEFFVVTLINLKDNIC